MSAWQPIATAPRDGTPVLVVRGGRISISSYYHRQTYEFGKLVRTHEGWSYESGALFGWTPPEPTHWMPLPDLPAPDSHPVHAAIAAGNRT